MHIALFGCAGTNLGDNAIAEVICRHLTGQLPQARITLWSIAPERMPAMPRVDVCWLDRRTLRGWWRIMKTIGQADHVLIGGGTLVQDKLGISMARGVLPYVTQIALLARLMGKPVLFAGVGADELTTPLGRRLARWLLRCVTGGFVRDEASHQRLRLIAEEPLTRLEVGDDPALLLEPTSAGDQPASARILVSLALDAVPAGLRQPILEWIADTVEAGAERLATQDIGFILMDDRSDEDQEAFAKLDEVLVQRGIDVSRIPRIRPVMAGNAQAILRRCNLLIAMRLHAMILAAGHVPIVAISRSEKTAAFAARCDAIVLDGTRPLTEQLSGYMAIECALRHHLRPEHQKLRRSLMTDASRALSSLMAVFHKKGDPHKKVPSVSIESPSICPDGKHSH